VAYSLLVEISNKPAKYIPGLCCSKRNLWEYLSFPTATAMVRRRKVSSCDILGYHLYDILTTDADIVKGTGKYVIFEVFTAVTIKNAVFWGITPQFLPHRKHITSPLQSPVS
jgi:hypothetical protein